MAKGQAQQLPPLEDELPLPDPNSPVRKKTLESELGGGTLPVVGGDQQGPDVEPLPAGANPPDANDPPRDIGTIIGSGKGGHTPDPSDPFAEIGGGVRLPNGDWVPRDHPLAAGAGSNSGQAQGNAGEAPGNVPAAASDPNDPFAATGGGVQLPNGDWVPRDHPLAAGAGHGGGLGDLPPTSAAANPAGAGGGPANSNTVQGAYKNALENLLEGPTPHEAGKNAADSAPVHAYRVQRKHQEGKDRALLAERNAAGGFAGSGGAETGVLGLRQAASRDIGQYAGQQAQVAEAGRRQELLAGLATAQAMGDAEAARELQKQLADLSHSEFNDQLNFDTQDRQAYWNQKALEMLFSGIGGSGA